MDISKIIEVQNKNESFLLKKANVISVGCGFKKVNGKSTSELSIIVGVSNKLPETSVRAFDIIPREIDGVSIDVVETGKISANVYRKTNDAMALNEIDPKTKYRPAVPGLSVGHKFITAGTLGCLVEKNGTILMLSNNHVFANSNDAQIGDAIFQPGRSDGGSSADEIGELFEFVPIFFEDNSPSNPSTPCWIANKIANAANHLASFLNRNSRLLAYSIQEEPNVMDAAIAKPTQSILSTIVEIGTPKGTAEATLDTEVQKYGRTTRYTKDTIIQINATIRVSYGSSGEAIFKQQLIAGPMSSGGDSGSAVLDMNKNVIGLLFAGSDTTTIISPIQPILSKFEASLVTRPLTGIDSLI